MYGTIPGYPQYHGILSTFIHVHVACMLNKDYPGYPQEYLTLRDVLRQLGTTCGGTGHVCYFSTNV